MGMLADDIIKSKGAFSPDAIFLRVVNELLVPTTLLLEWCWKWNAVL